MNVLLFAEHELDGSVLRLSGSDRRALHISQVLNLGPGDELRVGMINGELGTGHIQSSQDGSYEIGIRLGTPPAEKPGIELILALPRPIMLQRILKQATVLGVKRFHLIRSRRVHKSFFQAHILEQGAMQNLLVQGLEQAVDTRLPEVHVHERFRPFVEDVVPGIASGSRLVAHPDEKNTLAGLYLSERIGADVVLAVGPEGGWIDHEIQSFARQGFIPFSMGQRVLHVDTAVMVLLAQLQILQELSAAQK